MLLSSIRVLKYLRRMRSIKKWLVRELIKFPEKSKLEKSKYNRIT